MKYATIIFLFLAFLILVGCSDQQVSIPVEPTVVRSTQVTTFTPEPALTATQAFTLPPSPTIYMSPTATPEIPIAGTYDIADVRLSFPREDTVVVDFKYSLEESRRSRDTYIYMSMPPNCRDDGYYTPHYVAKDLVGEARLEFKYTLQGVCEVDAIEFVFHSDPNQAANAPFYREYVLQPYRLVRDFPTVNSNTLKIENFTFTAGSNWRGTFTFDYSISEEIPIPPEEYIFVVRGFGPDGGCAFWTNGSVVTEHSGEYQISIDLTQNLLFPYKNCLQGLEKYTYTTSFLYVRDLDSDTDIYSQALTDPYTILKSR